MLAGTLATLAALAVALLATLAALAAHHASLVLASSGQVVAASILAVLARIAAVATSSVGHFIFRTAIFFTRVGKIHLFSRPEATLNL